jgi:hypothetical protein
MFGLFPWCIYIHFGSGDWGSASATRLSACPLRNPPPLALYTLLQKMAPVEIPHDLIGQSSLYNHPDPLLRRLRLDDSSGGSITDLDRTFKGKEVLVLYAGSEHGSSESGNALHLGF